MADAVIESRTSVEEKKNQVKENGSEDSSPKTAELSVEDHVSTDARLFRPHSVSHLMGNPSKARSVLGWESSVDFNSLVEMMYKSDLEKCKSEL